MQQTDPTALLTPLVFDTDLLPEPARFPAWKSALSSLHVSFEGKEPFAARASLWLLETLVLTHAAVAPLRYERDEERVKQDLKDHIAIVVLLEGEFVGDYGYGPATSAAGSMTLLDMSRPCWTEATQLEAFVLSLPRAFLIPQLEHCDPHGMVVTGGLTAILAGFLTSAAAALPTLPKDHAPTIALRIRDLVVDALLDAHNSRSDPRVRNDVLVSRVRAHIDANLDAPLDATSICASLNISRSKLYRAFGGGVLQQIQRRRLHALRALLADPQEKRSIAELAKTVGFADKSYLSRLFKREYGCTPGEYRTSGPQQDFAVPIDEIPLVFDKWTKLLD